MEDSSTMIELDSIESRNAKCAKLFGCLNESLKKWGNKLAVNARMAYLKMA